MEKVGVRKFKNHLGRYLKKVKAGTIVTITDHNKPVARLVPLSSQLPDKVNEMLEDGKASWSGGKPGCMTPVSLQPHSEKTLGEMAAEDRR